MKIREAYLRHRARVLGVGGFLIGLLLGPGVLWQLKGLQIQQRATEVTVARLTLDARARLGEMLPELFNLSGLYTRLRDCDAAAASYPAAAKMASIAARIDFLRDDVKQIEGQLAALERRPSRDIQTLWVPPPAVTGLTVSSSMIRDGVRIPLGTTSQGPPEPKPPCPSLAAVTDSLESFLPPGFGSTGDAPRVTSILVNPKSIELPRGSTARISISAIWSDGSTELPTMCYTATGGTIDLEGLYGAGQTPGNFFVIARVCASTIGDTVAIRIR